MEGDAQVEGGSYGTATSTAGSAARTGRRRWRLGAYYNSTDSVSAFDKAFGGKEDDGFHTAGASGRFTYDLTPDLQFDERAYYTWSRNEFDGYDTPSTGFSQFGDDAEFGRTQQVVDYTGLELLDLFDGRLKNRIAYRIRRAPTVATRTPVRKIPTRPGHQVHLPGAQGRSQTFDYEGDLRHRAGL